MSGKRKNKPTSIGDTLLSRTGRAKGVVVKRDPPPEPAIELIPEEEPIDTEEEDEIERYEMELAQAEDADEEEDFEADDFEEYVRTLDEEQEEERRGEDVRTVREFLKEKGDAKRLRKVRYMSQEEAEEFLASSGIAGFAEVLYFENEDLFGIAVYDSPGVTVK